MKNATISLQTRHSLSWIRRSHGEKAIPRILLAAKPFFDMEREGARRRILQEDSGWTLIEIILMASILMVLAALLLPVTQNLIRKGQGVVCASHMRIISSSILEWAADHNGAFPPYSFETMRNGIVEEDFGKEKRWSEELFKSIGKEVFCCPTLRTIRFGQPQFVDYGYNYAWLGSTQQGKIGSQTWVDRGRPTAHLGQLSNPAQTLLLAESLVTSGEAEKRCGFYLIQPKNNKLYRMDARHGSQILVCWADGHCSYEEPDKDYQLPEEWFHIDKETSLP